MLLVFPPLFLKGEENMKLNEVIQKLNQLGIKITYRKRGEKEGKGIRITSINGVKYTGSTGNIVARGLIGASVGTRPKVAPLDSEVKKALTRAQRKFRKSGTKAGRPKTKNVRYNLKEKGKEETLRLLKQAERYAVGLAYVENVESMISRFKIYASKAKTTSQNSINAIIELLEKKKQIITEEQLENIREVEYSALQNSIAWETALIRIKDILK